MPLEVSILNIYGYQVEEIAERDPVIIRAKYTEQVLCLHCGSEQLRIKDTFRRRLRHESIGARKTILELEAHKYFCKSCGKYFNQRFPGILPRKRSTEGFRLEVFQKHYDGVCQSTLSKRLKIGSATVERWYHDFLELTVAEMKNNPCPLVMGIDEHFFSRKHGYATTICNLARHRVHDIVLDRSEASLEAYFKRLQGKERVQVVLMDLAETYRCIIRKHFPNAKIVADRFHVVRLINYYFLKLWQQIDPIGRKNRGLLSLMRRHEENLSPEQRVKLFKYLDEHQGLRSIYEFKQKLTQLMLMKKQTKKQCRRLIPVYLEYIYQLKNSVFESMVTLGKTLESWSEEVVRMWRFTKSNGITEGFHNKMEMISRRAYGFRNFENYRLRVRALCC